MNSYLFQNFDKSKLINLNEEIKSFYFENGKATTISAHSTKPFTIMYIENHNIIDFPKVMKPKYPILSSLLKIWMDNNYINSTYVSRLSSFTFTVTAFMSYNLHQD